MDISKTISAIAKSAESSSRQNNKDYENDGLIMCGLCHTAKQCLVKMPDAPEFIANCVCNCEENREKEVKLKRRANELRMSGLQKPQYLEWTFEKDDKRDPAISITAQKYVDNFSQMKSENIGLLFLGPIGTGKSFFAACIANALIDKGISVLMTSFPQLLREIQSASFGDRQHVFSRFETVGLLIVDDLGIERSTEYSLEQLFSVVDTRYLSGKPMIVTTNLSAADFKTEALNFRRVYDRITQNSIPIRFAGESRRKEIAKQKAEKYKSLLGL